MGVPHRIGQRRTIHGLELVDTVDTADIVHTIDILDIVKSVNSVDNVSSVNSVYKFQAMDGPPMANSVRTSHAKS